jgi:hypothetical protein
VLALRGTRRGQPPPRHVSIAPGRRRCGLRGQRPSLLIPSLTTRGSAPGRGLSGTDGSAGTGTNRPPRHPRSPSTPSAGRTLGTPWRRGSRARSRINISDRTGRGDRAAPLAGERGSGCVVSRWRAVRSAGRRATARGRRSNSGRPERRRPQVSSGTSIAVGRSGRCCNARLQK